MNEVPFIAIVAIGMVVFVIVVMNLGMVMLLRNPSKFKLDRKAPPNTAPGLGNLVKVLRDPFAEERGQLNELSTLVQDLDKQKPNGSDQPNGSQKS